MKLKIIAHAHAKQSLGFDSIDIECAPCDTPRELLFRWKGVSELPLVKIAVDEVFHDWDKPIGKAREMVIMPPFAGG